jgi:hypothetical protein
MDGDVTVYRSLLARGYFPKELPPAFFTELFARFATTQNGRAAISAYKPADNFTECAKYRLALPGLDRRELRIAHPYSFAKLAQLTAKNLGRLLRKAAASPFSRSRPIYVAGRPRAILSMVRHQNLARERAAMRAGSSYLLKTDVSQFYPSLYTHAVGWAIDPKLRKKDNWKRAKLLGKQIDQALMDLDGKLSQGIPIGNDISFLLAEIVLSQVDKAIRPSRDRAYRWFDDYELAFDSVSQAEETLKKLNKELAKFNLRLNAKKTSIRRLPLPAQEGWQEQLRQAGESRFTSPRDIVRYFDIAFRLREEFHDAAVLLYALGLLFKIRIPNVDVGRIAQSCITQTMLCEAGAAQKAFALLTYWRLNGFVVNTSLITDTVNQMVAQHQAIGFSSDIAWALAYCLQERFALSKKAAQALCIFDDDFIALQALDMENRGLLPKGFSSKKISKGLKDADLDREHWLIAYETVRHGFLPVCKSAVKGNSFFSELLKHGITFYRRDLPPYSQIIHSGGAPDWIVQAWMKLLIAEHIGAVDPEMERAKDLPVFRLIESDLNELRSRPETRDEAIIGLIDRLLPGGSGTDGDDYPS